MCSADKGYVAEAIKIMTHKYFQPPQMLKNLMMYRNILSPNSLKSKMLARFYSDGTLATCDIHEVDLAYNTISVLARRNDLQKIDNCHRAARYEITLQGKFKILCEKFGIKFLCLCILVETYAVHKIQIENGCPTSYSLFEMNHIFEDIYSKKTIRNSANILVAKKLVYSKSRNLITMQDSIFKDLSLHDDAILDEMHMWIVGIPGYLDRLTLENPQAYDEILHIR